MRRYRSMIGEVIRLLYKTKPPENGREERVKAYLEMPRKTRLFAPKLANSGDPFPSLRRQRSGGLWGDMLPFIGFSPSRPINRGLRHTVRG